jgi:hypothetical protein
MKKKARASLVGTVCIFNTCTPLRLGCPKGFRVTGENVANATMTHHCYLRVGSRYAGSCGARCSTSEDYSRWSSSDAYRDQGPKSLELDPETDEVVVVVVDRVVAHDAARLRSVDHAAAANVDSDVRPAIHDDDIAGTRS